MAAKHSSFKKSLKEPDEFITFSSRMLQSIILNKNKILSALGAIFGLVLVVLVFGYFSEKSEKRSLFQLSQIMAKYTDQKVPGEMSEVKEELQALIDTYGRYSGGKFAQLELANLYFNKGDYDQAVERYRRTVKDFQDDPLLGMLAKSNLGYSLEAKGALAEAAECFESVAANSKDVMVDESLFTLSRLYAALGKPEKQLEVSNRLVEKHPDSFYIDLVKEKAAK